MTSRDVQVSRRFFDAMDKTEKIRQDCQVLMAGEDGPTQVGLDIMSSTSSNLEQAYEKIFRWCSFEFRQMGREVQVEVSPTMHEAITRLRQRQELLRYYPYLQRNLPSLMLITHVQRSPSVPLTKSTNGPTQRVYKRPHSWRPWWTPPTNRITCSRSNAICRRHASVDPPNHCCRA